MKQRLRKGFLVGLVFVATMGLFVAWKTRPQTKLAGRFSVEAFEAIQVGTSEVEVNLKLGSPLASWVETKDEAWCFEGKGGLLDRVLARPLEAECFYVKDGVVISIRSERPSELEAFRGRTTGSLVQQLGKPKYVVPAGLSVTLRYSEPLQPTDSYEVFLVILDEKRVVRGTQHYIFFD